MRDSWLPTFGLAFMVIAMAVLVGVCRQSVIADQQPLLTMTSTPGAVATFTLRVTTPTLLVPTASSTPAGPTSTSTSTLTPLPTVTATQERRASEFNTPAPTATQPAPPAQVPAQVPRSGR